MPQEFIIGAGVALLLAVVTIWIITTADHGSAVDRWTVMLDQLAQWVLSNVPPILWPVTWPFFAVAYLMVVPIACFSSRLFVPQRFRR